MAPPGAGANKTNKQKNNIGDDAKSKARTRGTPKPSAAAAASIPTPSSSSPAPSHAMTEGGPGRSRRRGHGQTEDGFIDDSDDEDGRQPAEASRRLTQRQRDRKAATKCRAKTKAAMDQLAVDEQAMADIREALSAEVTALREQALNLRMLVLQRHSCTCGQMQAYIRNSAGAVGKAAVAPSLSALTDAAVLPTRRAGTGCRPSERAAADLTTDTDITHIPPVASGPPHLPIRTGQADADTRSGGYTLDNMKESHSGASHAVPQSSTA